MPGTGNCLREVHRVLIRIEGGPPAIGAEVRQPLPGSALQAVSFAPPQAYIRRSGGYVGNDVRKRIGVVAQFAGVPPAQRIHTGIDLFPRLPSPTRRLPRLGDS